MSARFVEIPVADGAFRALRAGDPADAARPAVLLLPEIYNINGWIRDVAGRYAARGYCVLVPDLFWRQTPGIDLEYTPEDQQRGRVLSAGLDRAGSVDDLRAAAEWLRGQGARHVAAVGFCLGGELACLAAAAGALDAAVAYYPTRMENHLAAVAHIAVPLLIHIGAHDHRTPPALVADLRAALAGRPLARIDVYPDADHGFGRHGHPPHHPASAVLAEQQTLRVLDALSERSEA